MKKPLLLYLLTTFAVPWAVWFLMILFHADSTLFYSVTSLCMWAPALGVLAVNRFSDEKVSLQELLSPRVRGSVKYYVFAWFSPLVFSVLGGALYFIVFPLQLDRSFGYINSLIQANGLDLNVKSVILQQIASAVTAAPLLNSLFAIGEEIGWRGYLTPALQKKYSRLQAALLSGLIWSVWHFPVNLTGYNYGTSYPGFPFTGILAMFVMCFGCGVILSALREKTSSLWPCAIMHGAINAVSAFPLYFQKMAFINGKTSLLGPSLNGIIAALPMVLFALYLLKKETGK